MLIAQFFSYMCDPDFDQLVIEKRGSLDLTLLQEFWYTIFHYAAKGLWGVACILANSQFSGYPIVVVITQVAT